MAKKQKDKKKDNDSEFYAQLKKTKQKLHTKIYKNTLTKN